MNSLKARFEKRPIPSVLSRFPLTDTGALKLNEV
jgi:hypothetical protein